MQHLQKKDSEGVIFCPKCHARNISSQKSCGKCGYIFPVKGNEAGKKRGSLEDFAPQVPGSPGYGGNIPQANETGYIPQPPGQEGEQQTQDGEEQEPEEPQVPKSLSDRGKSEGHIRGIGLKTVCQICGAENNAHVRRCIRCGNKFASSKK